MCILVYFILIILVIYLFDKYAYEIDQFLSKLRVFFRYKVFNLRTFDEYGIPHSYSMKHKEKFISPFYVVHYGLIYSRIYKNTLSDTKIHWQFDKTLDLWNEPPKIVKKEFFIHAADWIVENITELEGCHHIIYRFDWIYKGYPNGMLKAPWYSGLTDAYSIILLLRAYDITKDRKYLDSARKLYETSVTHIKDGGNLNYLNGFPWIEEYIDPKVIDYGKLPFVLNGMIYATFGIISYENYIGISNGYSDKLIESIIANLVSFVKGKWSYYDLIGTSANLKYHRIHVGLLEELIEYITKKSPKYSNYTRYLEDIKDLWEKSLKHSGIFYILYGERSFAYYNFVAFFLFFLLLCFIVGGFICKNII